MDELAEIMIQQGRLAEAEKLLPELDRLVADTPDYRELENRRYIEGILALARGRPREAIPLLERNKPMSAPGRFQAQRADALSRAYAAIADTARAVSELEWIQATDTMTLDVHALFQTMATLASLYERTGRREEALGIYRRLEAQYRGADPGCRLGEVGVKGMRRLSRA